MTHLDPGQVAVSLAVEIKAREVYDICLGIPGQLSHVQAPQGIA